MRNFLMFSISHFLDHFDYIDPAVIPPEREDADAEPEEADADSQDADAKTNEVCIVVTSHFTMCSLFFDLGCLILTSSCSFIPS